MKISHLFSLLVMPVIILFLFSSSVKASMFSTSEDIEFSISAHPTFLRVPDNGSASSRISWRALGVASASVWVRVNGGKEELFARSHHGLKEINWIKGGNIYEFNLYGNEQKTMLIDSVTIIAAPKDDHFDQYAPLNARKGGWLINKGTNTAMSQWSTAPISDSMSDIGWASPDNLGDTNFEEWGIKKLCARGEDYVWIHAYRDSRGNRFPIRTTRAVFINEQGESFDITEGGTCGVDGQPYALYHIKNERYTLKVWGDLMTIHGEVGRRFYWEHTITPYQKVRNQCWKSDEQNLRITIRQDEAWWDSDSQWVLGSGHIDQTTGEPDGTHVVYGRYQTIARGAGYGWTFSTHDPVKPLKACMEYGWSW